MTEIDYYFSPISPWSYLGHGRLGEIARGHGAAVRLKPVDHLRVFTASGGQPLHQRPPQRQAYRLAELRRWRDHLGLPLNLQPRHWPVPVALAARAMLAAEALGDRAFDFAGLCLAAVWVEDRDISDPDTLAAIGASLGYDGAQLLERAGSEETAERFTALTNEAISAQVFGVPSYILDGELFWGQDRLDFLERALAARG